MYLKQGTHIFYEKKGNSNENDLSTAVQVVPVNQVRNQKKKGTAWSNNDILRTIGKFLGLWDLILVPAHNIQNAYIYCLFK